VSKGEVRLLADRRRVQGTHLAVSVIGRGNRPGGPAKVVGILAVSATLRSFTTSRRLLVTSVTDYAECTGAQGRMNKGFFFFAQKSVSDIERCYSPAAVSFSS
jgi:hypothetical protein